MGAKPFVRTEAPAWLTPHRAAMGIAAVAALGGLLRAWPFLALGQVWRVPVDYDDGVYFAASALLSQGVLPYRDFTFVHPPGLLLFLLPIAGLAGQVDPAAAFSAARWAAIAVGAFNVFLAGRLGLRAAGPIAGLAAAAFYAAYPEAIIQERGPYLEPILNLCCLALASAWLSTRASRSLRFVAMAGALLGFAVAVKVWAGVWALACLASLPRPRRLASFAVIASSSLAVASACVLPFLLAAPGAFFEQAVLFHSWRPPDGIPDRLARLPEMGRLHLVVTGLALFGLASRLLFHYRHGQEPEAGRHLRFFGTAYLLIAAAFLGARTYWFEYNSHLAAAETALAGLGAAELWRLLSPLPRPGPALAGLLLLASPIHSLRHCLRQAKNRDDNIYALGEAVRRLVPKGECFIPFEPVWGLTGGRLPTVRPPAPAVVDSYAAMLIAAMRGGESFPHATDALHSAPAQERAKELLSGCRFLALGGRGHWQLTEESKAWLSSAYERLHPPPGEDSVDIWMARAIRRADPPSP